MVIVAPTTLQWSLFRTWWLAAGSGAVLAAVTWFAVRWALGEFAGEMRWRLHLMKAGTNQMFREIE